MVESTWADFTRSSCGHELVATSSVVREAKRTRTLSQWPLSVIDLLYSIKQWTLYLVPVPCTCQLPAAAAAVTLRTTCTMTDLGRHCRNCRGAMPQPVLEGEGGGGSRGGINLSTSMNAVWSGRFIHFSPRGARSLAAGSPSECFKRIKTALCLKVLQGIPMISDPQIGRTKRPGQQERKDEV